MGFRGQKCAQIANVSVLSNSMLLSIPIKSKPFLATFFTLLSNNPARVIPIKSTPFACLRNLSSHVEAVVGETVLLPILLLLLLLMLGGHVVAPVPLDVHQPRV